MKRNNHPIVENSLQVLLSMIRNSWIGCDANRIQISIEHLTEYFVIVTIFPSEYCPFFTSSAMQYFCSIDEVTGWKVSVDSRLNVPVFKLSRSFYP